MQRRTWQRIYNRSDHARGTSAYLLRNPGLYLRGIRSSKLPFVCCKRMVLRSLMPALLPYNWPYDLSSCSSAEGRYTDSIQVLEGHKSKSMERRKTVKQWWKTIFFWKKKSSYCVALCAYCQIGKWIWNLSSLNKYLLNTYQVPDSYSITVIKDIYKESWFEDTLRWVGKDRYVNMMWWICKHNIKYAKLIWHVGLYKNLSLSVWYLTWVFKLISNSELLFSWILNIFL